MLFVGMMQNVKIITVVEMDTVYAKEDVDKVVIQISINQEIIVTVRKTMVIEVLSIATPTVLWHLSKVFS